jgi:hypothetical protein
MCQLEPAQLDGMARRPEPVLMSSLSSSKVLMLVEDSTCELR